MIHAAQNGWAVPVYSEKWQSDENYERCAGDLLASYPSIELALGSHNLRSLGAALAFAENKSLPRNALEVQMLYGMAEPFKTSLVRMGYRLRDYDPIGELIPGLSYLVRRLLENSANDSFLKQIFLSQREVSDLLRDPRQTKRTRLEIL